jgi:STE24 endopeptidase
MNAFTLVFVIALAAGVALELWLLRRQSAFVTRHAGRVPDAFAPRIGLPEHRRAADYTLAHVAVSRVDAPIGALVLLALTLGGGLDALHRLWDGSGLGTLWAGTGFVLSVFLLLGVLELPFELWRTFGIEARFGFNRTTAARFVADKLVGTGLGLLLGIPLTLAILWLMTEASGLWWLYAWAVWMTFSLAISWAYPRVIAPLFNRFTPLDPGALRTRLEQLLARCGFRSDGMFVMDGSRRSSHGNAYFTGLGRTKRIVFFDTLLQALEPEELEAVLAHELGHFRLRHIAKRLAVVALTTLAGFALLGWLAGQPWFYAGLGSSAATAPMALVLFLVAMPVYAQFLRPLASWLSRRQEFEADAFAAEHADGEALVRALVKLYRDNASTLTPDPLYSAYHHTHPPAPVRIARLEARQGG